MKSISRFKLGSDEWLDGCQIRGGHQSSPSRKMENRWQNGTLEGVDSYSQGQPQESVEPWHT